MNIPCEVILDLIPLVRDGASSEEAKQMVEDHVAQCAPCRGEYESYSPNKQNAITIEDKKVLRTIRNSIIVSKFAAIGAILLVCMAALTLDYRFYFYNYFLMLVTGVISYFMFGARRWILPIAIFAASLLWRGIDMVQRGATIEFATLWWLTEQCFIYAALTAAGLLVGFLFRYAFSPSYQKKGRDLNENQ